MDDDDDDDDDDSGFGKPWSNIKRQALEDEGRRRNASSDAKPSFLWVSVWNGICRIVLHLKYVTPQGRSPS